MVLSTDGRLVDSCMPLSTLEDSNACWSSDTSPEITGMSARVNFAISGCASHVPVDALSAPAVSELVSVAVLLAVGAKEAGLTSSGP